jgi:hypothetical protein
MLMAKETKRRSSSVGDQDLEHIVERLIASARKFSAAAGKARAAYDTWSKATQEKYQRDTLYTRFDQRSEELGAPAPSADDLWIG